MYNVVYGGGGILVVGLLWKRRRPPQQIILPQYIVVRIVTHNRLLYLWNYNPVVIQLVIPVGGITKIKHNRHYSVVDTAIQQCKRYNDLV
jgi:hypothetical protein